MAIIKRAVTVLFWLVMLSLAALVWLAWAGITGSAWGG